MPRPSPEAPVLYMTQIAHGRLKKKKSKRHYSHSQGAYNLTGKLKTTTATTIENNAKRSLMMRKRIN